MNARPLEKKRMTPVEYLAFEKHSTVKHEYFNGEMFAMTGASLNHNQINHNISGELRNRLKDSDCRALSSDMRVKISELEQYTYPDIMIVCGVIELETIEGLETLLNPTVIMEILSDSTEAYDRGKKFQHYRLMQSLQEYILVSQNQCLVEKYVRCDAGKWIYFSHEGMNQILTVELIGCELPLSEIYDRIDFPAICHRPSPG